jgi:hypothetical protein
VTFTVEAPRAIFLARPELLCDLFFTQAGWALQTLAETLIVFHPNSAP